MKCNPWYNKSFAPQPDKKEVNNMGFTQQYILFSISSLSRMYIPLPLKQPTNYDFSRTGEVKTFILECWYFRKKIKKNNLVSPLFSQGKISLIELQDTG